MKKCKCGVLGLIPVVPQCKARVCSRSLVGIADSNPAGGMDVCHACCMLSGRGVCIGIIILPEGSYLVWCVWVWSWSLSSKEALAHWGLLCHGKKKGVLGEWQRG